MTRGHSILAIAYRHPTLFARLLEAKKRAQGRP
jgi:hypothetical protein